MSVRTVRTKEDALKVKLGDAYIIDVFPPPEQEDQEITQEMLDMEVDLEQLIAENLSKPKVVLNFKKSTLNKMKEADIVEIAVAMGIKASVDDRRSDTIAAIMEKQEELSKMSDL